MLGKNCTKVFDHIFSRRLTVKFSGDHSLTPCIIVLNFVLLRQLRAFTKNTSLCINFQVI
jgi:hypothetical protein